MLRALTPIEHDGRRYEPGELVPADGAAADALLAAGAAEPAPQAATEQDDGAGASRSRARKGG